MTSTPTSGAADLPEALRSIQRFEVVDCIDDKHVPAVIPNPHGPWVRYEDHIAALAASHGQAPASVLHLVHSAFAEIAMAFPKAFALHKVGIADTAVREALAAPAPPPECETEAEKRAFAFGWFKALESERFEGRQRAGGCCALALA